MIACCPATGRGRGQCSAISGTKGPLGYWGGKQDRDVSAMLQNWKTKMRPLLFAYRRELKA